jgi:predicted metalloprotease with PDZ domain
MNQPQVWKPPVEQNLNVCVKQWRKRYDPWEGAPSWAVEIGNALALALDKIIKQERTIMALKDVVDDLEKSVEQMKSAEDGAEAAFIKLAEEIGALRADRTDPETAKRITDMSQTLKDRAARLAASIVAGTPAAEPDPTTDPQAAPQKNKAADTGKASSAR